MSLKSQIFDDMKASMKAKDPDRLGALRMLVSEIKKREIDSRTELQEPEVIKIIQSLVKQRRDSVTAFEKGGREDLASKERAEITLFEAYLPEALSEKELTDLIDQAIAETGANSMKDMGKVMGLVQELAAGRADGKTVSQLVKSRLQS